MPTIKGPITMGKNMTDADIEKYCKATGKVLLARNGKKIKDLPKKKKTGKINVLIPKNKK